MNDKTEQPVTDEPRGTAAGGHAVIINVPGCPLMVRAVDYNALRAEKGRLTACLEKANINAENFEREWYLRGDELDNLRAQLAEAQAALKTVILNAELSKEPCGPDPESPAAIRNGKFAGLASIAAQGLGMVRGPSLTEHLVEAQKDAERLDWIIEHRAYVVSDPDCCDGYWLNYARPDGTMWTQATEHETPRAAIDAAKGKTS